MAMFDNVNFVKNGERVTAEVDSRPIKDMIAVLEPKISTIESILQVQGSAIPKLIGISIDEAKLDNSVTSGMVVYVNNQGNILPAKADNPNVAKHFLGIYIKDDSVTPATHKIVVSGELELTGMNITSGTVFYISETTDGAITNTRPSSPIQVGIGIAENKILLKSGSDELNQFSNISSTIINLQDNIQTYDINYNPLKTIFYYEGLKLPSNKYTTGNGTSITLGFNPKTNEILEVIQFK